VASDGVRGVSVLNYAKDVLELAKSAEASAKEFFASGMNINGILSCATMLNEKQRQDIRNSWTLGGGKTSLQILPANIQYQAIGTDAAKAQLLESRQHETIEIARYFNVPIQLIQAGDKLTYNKLEEFNLLYLQHTLSPYITSIEQEFTRKLFPGESDMYVDFHENFNLLSTDKGSTTEYLSKLVTSGIMTVNEARTELGLPNVEGGDKLSVAYSDVQQNTIA
jgi:HK97 family phage portal protein